MDSDELEPRRPAAAPVNLESLSVAELEEFIAAREADIEQARLMIAKKRNVRAGADALFKK